MPARAARAPAGTRMSAPLRVLFVEDNPADVELIVHELRREGYALEWEVVEDRAGMETALQRPWDVIVSDHSMPRFDAPEALEVLKASGQDLPFLVVSGHIGEETAVATMKAGAHDWVAKDHLVRLAPAIARELREADQRRQRVAAEAALRESESRYRLLVEHAADVIVMIDAEGRVIFQSPSTTRVLGYAEGAMLGRPVLSFVHADDTDHVSQLMAEALQSGGPVSVDSVRIQHQDASWRTFEGSGARMLDANGQPVLVAAARDITERVLLQQQLIQSQKMEAVGRLAGGVAHDFNNLLTVMLGYSNLLLDQLAENPLLHQEVDEIKRAATRAAGLTQQLLAFSRKQVLALRVVDLNRELDGMSGMLRQILGEDVSLEMRLKPDVGRVRVDPGQLEQVIMNLVINARDAMPEGGRLKLTTRDVALDERQARPRGMTPGRYVQVEVSDNGSGMDEQTLARLFEPFFTTKEPGKGTGLGLSTAYGIVRQSGGSLYADSTMGEGSTFHILLPRVEEPLTAPEAPARGGVARGSETVLLVEDEPLVRSLVHDILRKAGYQVLESGRGEEAVQIARRHEGTIHLLLTDVVMPGMGGLETARHVLRLRPDIRVLYLSGYTDELVMRHGALGPGQAFMPKPFTPDALLRKVRELIEPGPVMPVEQAARWFTG